MCVHENPEEARRCICTGYGFGDPPCRCGHPKSSHADGTGACIVPAARCHEFVLRLDDPFPVTVALVQAAADAIMVEHQIEPLMAQQLAMSALFAGRQHAMARDFEIKSVRAQNDRLSKQLARAEEELTCHRTTAPGASG